MLRIKYSARFKKDYKILKKRGYDTRLFVEVLDILSARKHIPKKYLDHALKGDYIGYRELHITPDWLLIYKIKDKELILELTRTGTHSDLF